MKIQTVKGIIDNKDLNIVDAHVHIWIKKPEKNSGYSIPELSDFQMIKSSLEDFKKNGGSLIVDCTPYGCGRDGNKLLEISEKSGVEIVSVTGFHRREYYAPNSEVWGLSLADASFFFIDEIENGLKETLNTERKIKAGLIKIPFIGILESSYETLTNAAIQAAIKTETPVLIHTEQGFNIEWFSDYLIDNGVSPRKVVFCHVDKRNDISFHEKLAAKGFYLEYDTFLREKYKPEKNTWNLMSSMIKSGFEKSLMLGSDIFGNSMWGRVRAEIGYGGFFKKLAQSMVEKYEDSGVVMDILGGNAARFLSLK